MIVGPSMRCAAQGLGLRLSFPAVSASTTQALTLRHAAATPFRQRTKPLSAIFSRRCVSSLALELPPRAGGSGSGSYGRGQGARLNLSMAASGTVIAALAISAFKQQSNTIACEDLSNSRSYASSASLPLLDEGHGERPESIVNLYQLSFGTVCGVCAGIFIKKGLKLIAFLLGGTFVLMQYFSSQRWITIDWKAIGSKYETVVNTAAGGTADPAGNPITHSRAARIWQRLVDFLTADFQQRATFTAGLILGFRLG
ncbi:hypothetical protein K437DRAFT_256898 [Tilletiaria anomala UBC 951]|uniref:FUN14-domain-containing protein n=1 Tax=Tilletiaria anomala (strain ATCC 24038 / CBS 436.72 / UBC 951) TaxID=1037660 RepID=A0A066VSP0_TILAU|nr:uncharacterized protein K437DRAFT_256898 [Tilletiaria anomala UBC 951]KDN44752.1 hypothetical protein K437DRAFT_256898 [Tilletiaria anomala UBC 951]